MMITTSDIKAFALTQYSLPDKPFARSNYRQGMRDMGWDMQEIKTPPISKVASYNAFSCTYIPAQTTYYEVGWEQTNLSIAMTGFDFGVAPDIQRVYIGYYWMAATIFYHFYEEPQ
jgi:hypothetical protein